jgi:nucleotide-binding universal stress UspA family protein
MDARVARILVPLDGSSLAEAVLPWAERMAEIFGSTLVLLHVLERGAPESVHGERHLQAPAAADRYLREVAQRFSAGVAVDRHVHPNAVADVARGIAEHAAELRAGLIVLATHGAGGIRGLLFGRIAQQVLAHGATPVLLVRPGVVPPAPDALRSVLVALDGTPEGEAALPLARSIAAAEEARLYLIQVVPTVRTVRGSAIPVATFLPTATAKLLEIEEHDAAAYLELVAARLAPLDAWVAVRRGDVSDELTAAAREIAPDLVVMSTHGKAGIDSLLSGSIGARFFARIRQPLLLVRVTRDA